MIIPTAQHSGTLGNEEAGDTEGSGCMFPEKNQEPPGTPPSLPGLRFSRTWLLNGVCASFWKERSGQKIAGTEADMLLSEMSIK